MTAHRTAMILIERHGAEAGAVARRWVDELTRSGAERSAEHWRHIAAAIEEIEAEKRRQEQRKRDGG